MELAKLSRSRYQLVGDMVHIASLVMGYCDQRSGTVIAMLERDRTDYRRPIVETPAGQKRTERRVGAWLENQTHFLDWREEYRSIRKVG